MSSRKPALVDESLEPLIFVVRNQRVILDADLARLYGVTTKVFNQAVKRNGSRFPKDFAFQLTTEEVSGLRSQTVTLNPETLEDFEGTGNWSQFATSSNRSQIVTGSQKHRDPRFRPWAFTEHGALMAANILRSKQAVHMSVFVVRAFVRLREHIVANQAILKRLAEIDRALLQHDSGLLDLYEKLLPLLQPPPAVPKRRIGFQSKGKP